jgi:hypothetical protein
VSDWQHDSSGNVIVIDPDGSSRGNLSFTAGQTYSFHCKLASIDAEVHIRAGNTLVVMGQNIASVLGQHGAVGSVSVEVYEHSATSHVADVTVQDFVPSITCSSGPTANTDNTNVSAWVIGGANAFYLQAGRTSAGVPITAWWTRNLAWSVSLSMLPADQLLYDVVEQSTLQTGGGALAHTSSASIIGQALSGAATVRSTDPQRDGHTLALANVNSAVNLGVPSIVWGLVGGVAIAGGGFFVWRTGLYKRL